eukprot:3246641-Prorocentrum_lima.AAC.1
MRLAKRKNRQSHARGATAKSSAAVPQMRVFPGLLLLALRLPGSTGMAARPRFPAVKRLLRTAASAGLAFSLIAPPAPLRLADQLGGARADRSPGASDHEAAAGGHGGRAAAEREDAGGSFRGAD